MTDRPSQVAAGVAEGDILAGKYRIDKVLGVGGMGVVAAAHHIHLDDRVAVKFMLPEALANAEAVMRFTREARAAVRIKSEHVAKVTDVGTLETGAPYMVMEYLDGCDLAAWVQQSGALSVEQAVEFVLQACEAIAEAHALGIVHRDLKPANLFVVRRMDGGLSVKVLDFGISKMTGLGLTGPDMTRTAAVMGSPLYMSPEQMRSTKDVDARSDIWSLGVILYELLTGEVPFSGETMPELVLKVSADPLPPIRDKRPDLPEGLGDVVARCLDKDRGKRIQTVGELAVALLPYGPKRALVSVERISGVMRAAGFSDTALMPPTSSEPSGVAEASGTQSSWGRTGSSGGRSHSALAIGIGLALVALGLGAGALWWQSRSGPSSSASAAVPEAPPAAASAEPSKNVEPSLEPTAAESDETEATASAAASVKPLPSPGPTSEAIPGDPLPAPARPQAKAPAKTSRPAPKDPGEAPAAVAAPPPEQRPARAKQPKPAKQPVPEPAPPRPASPFDDRK